MRRDTGRERPWWYKEDDWVETLRQSLLGATGLMTGFSIGAWYWPGISFADAWATAFSLFLLLMALGGVIGLLGAGIATLALYRQRRDKKLGRHTEFQK